MRNNANVAVDFLFEKFLEILTKQCSGEYTITIFVNYRSSQNELKLNQEKHIFDDS